jgi:hypothetical protein
VLIVALLIAAHHSHESSGLAKYVAIFGQGYRTENGANLLEI